MISERARKWLVAGLLVIAIVSLTANIIWLRSEAKWRPLSVVCWPDGREKHFMTGEFSEQFRKDIFSEAKFIRFRVFHLPGRKNALIEMQETERISGKQTLLESELSSKSTQLAAAAEKAATGSITRPPTDDTCGYVAKWLIEPVGKEKDLLCYKGECQIQEVKE